MSRDIFLRRLGADTFFGFGIILRKSVNEIRREVFVTAAANKMGQSYSLVEYLLGNRSRPLT